MEEKKEQLDKVCRAFRAEQYKNYINPNGKYQTLLGFTDMRERFLQVPHESSVRLLYDVG